MKGTLEAVEGIAIIEPDGKGGFEYAGETEILWDNQETVQRNGEDVLICQNYHEWTKKKAE